MKHHFALLLRLVLTAALIMVVAVPSSAQTVKVTFRCNTSTCLDTLRPNHVVQLFGESKKPITPAITWSVGATMTNAGGDNWTTTLDATAGDSIQYKYVASFAIGTPTFHWSGWEGPLSSGAGWAGTNRAFRVGTTDTTLQVEYFNGWESSLAQYWKPFTPKPDSVAVYFRVNMGGVTFNPSTQTVEVWGGAPMGADPTWIRFATLAREVNSVNGGTFWSGAGYVAKSAVTAGALQKFKYVINTNGSQTWEGTSDRSFTFSNAVVNVKGDTTILWRYFNDQAPHGAQVTGNISFRLKLGALEKAGLFNRGLGDRVGLTGAKGWPPSPFTFATEPTMLKLTYVPAIQEWVLQEPFTLFPTTDIPYKYYIAWDTSRVSVGNVNYIPGLTLDNGWEEPGSTGGADRHYAFTDQASQAPAGDFGAAQQYFNSLHPKGVITTPITVNFTVDMAPAASSTTNPTNRLFIPGVDSVFVQFDGSLVPVTQGLTMWGTDNRVMLTDPNGDMKYTGSIALRAPTFYQLCYRIAYRSLPNTEVTNGGGVQRGRRYYQYVTPTSVKTDSCVWPTTFSLAQVSWSVGSLTIEDPPNLDISSGIDGPSGETPVTYALHQNYPNPFNPTTVISYQLPVASEVKLAVVDLLGREVAVLVHETRAAGVHSARFDGSGLASGIYFYRLEAGSFTQVQKMLLMK